MREKIRKKVIGAIQKDWDNAENNESYNDFDEKKRLMKFNRFFSNWRVFTTTYIVIAAGILILLVAVLLWTQSGLQHITGTEKSFFSRLYGLRFIIIFGSIAAVIGYFRFAYLVRVSFGNINIGQKGTARWTTRKELEQQYKKIPEKNETFPGMGGIPIARKGNEIYIDDTNTNTMIIGGTRSGKDEIYGRPFVDIISRAEEKCSMIITDPKLESAFATIPELKKRGYNTYVLNYIDPLFSDGYNPLDMIKEEYKDGRIDSAQNLCASLAYYIFAPNPEEKDPFWTDKARDVFIAFCYAEIEDNINADIEENRRRKAAHDLKENERKKKYYKRLYKNDYENYRKASVIRKILKVEPDLSDAEIVEEFYDMCRAKGIKMDITQEEIRKLRTFKFKRSEFIPKKYYPVDTNEKKITIYSIIMLCDTLSKSWYTKDKTYLDIYFEQRAEGNFARLTYGDLVTAPKSMKGSIMSVFRRGVTVFSSDNFAKLTAESTFKIEDIAFGEKPVAIFLGIPDYDKSKHFLATVFINQTVFLLSKLSLAMPGGKLPRRVHFWINEFGNLPIIENLENHLTVGLGRNIIWTLLLQSYGQLEKYGDIKQTIKDNCGNKIFIMASGEETTEEISKDIGSETQTVVNRTGRKLSINKEITEMSDEVPLMRPYQLKRLELEETIVLRTMKRTDLAGRTIKTHPIKNFGEYRMVMAHKYLSDVFPYEQLLYRSDGIDHIIRANPHYANMDWNIKEGYINTREYIDLRKRSRSGSGYIKRYSFANSVFPAGKNLSVDAMKRMNLIFNLMKLTDEQRELYQTAGDLNREGEIVEPSQLLRNIDIERYARQLIRSKDKYISMRGYQLLDALMPLAEKEKSDAELQLERQIENDIVNW